MVLFYTISMEEFKDINGYDGYQIGNLGSIRKKMKMGYKEITSHNRKGYWCCYVRINGKPMVLNTTRLVAEAFVDKPEGCNYIHYIDGDKSNYAADNLKWVTMKDIVKGKKDKCKKPVDMKGVQYLPYFKKFEAVIKIAGYRRSIGWFNTPEEAFIAYQKKIKELVLI